METAVLYCKSSCVLAGVPFVEAIFDYLGVLCKWNFEEGEYIDLGSEKKVVAATVTGAYIISNTFVAVSNQTVKANVGIYFSRKGLL